MYIALAIFLGLILLVLLFSYSTFRMVFLPPKSVNVYKGLDGEQTERKIESRAAIDKLKSTPYEEVRITSHDKRCLYGKYYHKNENGVTVIAFHGYRSAGVRDMARVFIEFERLGYNVLIVDQRSHGESSGRAISFGAREKYDVKDWADYVSARFESPRIFLYGISMGAATVIMASELSGLKNVFGIIADCPYSTPSAAIKHVMKNRGFPTFFFPFVRLGGILFGSFDIERHSAVSSAKVSEIPILLFHGDDDTFVPPTMSEEIYSAAKAENKNVSLVKIPEATHTLSIMFDRDLYARELENFVKNNTQ